MRVSSFSWRSSCLRRSRHSSGLTTSWFRRLSLLIVSDIFGLPLAEIVKNRYGVTGIKHCPLRGLPIARRADRREAAPLLRAHGTRALVRSAPPPVAKAALAATTASAEIQKGHMRISLYIPTSWYSPES